MTNKIPSHCKRWEGKTIFNVQWKLCVVSGFFFFCCSESFPSTVLLRSGQINVECQDVSDFPTAVILRSAPVFQSLVVFYLPITMHSDVFRNTATKNLSGKAVFVEKKYKKRLTKRQKRNYDINRNKATSQLRLSP